MQSTSEVDLATDSGRAFLQERLALLGRVGFLISLGFYFAGDLVLALTQPAVLAWRFALHPANLLHLGATAVLGATWLVCRRTRVFPLPVLRALDGGTGFLVCASPAIAELAWGRELPGQHFIMLLIVTNVLMARAVFVPSRPGRTFRISLACAAPTVLTSFAALDTIRVAGGLAPFSMVAVLWSLCAVAMATVTSQVIYGLRQQVREATQLGQYTLEEKLGEGGMGAVYRARHALHRALGHGRSLPTLSVALGDRREWRVPHTPR